LRYAIPSFRITARRPSFAGGSLTNAALDNESQDMDAMTKTKILPGTTDWLHGQLHQAKIMDRQALQEALEAFTKNQPFGDAAKFAAHLIAQGLLTEYQARRALEGEAKRLTVGSYTIRSVVGSGSLGAVYQAVGRGDKRSYALKVLPKRNQWNTRLARKQVEAMEKLPKVAGLVPFVDVGISQGMYYLAWPFCEGTTLEKHVQLNGPMAPEEVAKIAVQTARLLETCHENKILHGLIKPSNILLSASGDVQLLDFGIGAILAENGDEYETLFDTSSAATAMGRMLECGAPEIVVHSSRWTPYCDQYSLGCTLYYAITGRFPFPGGTFVDKISAHQSKKPTPVLSITASCPPILASTIMRMMEKSPLDRFPKIISIELELRELAGKRAVAKPIAAPVDERTPPPKSKMVIQLPVSAKSLAPIAFPMPASLLNAVGGKKVLRWFVGESNDQVMISIFGQGVARAGQEVHLHLAIHREADKQLILQEIAAKQAPLRFSASSAITKPIARGQKLGLHLHATLGNAGEPKRTLAWEGNATCLVYTLKLPSNCPPGPLPLKLYIGEGNAVIGQIEFALPVKTSSDWSTN
jgi:serine/threonine protein kinase